MPSWFENWFNSKYYHILYQNRNEDEAERFISNLSTFLNLDESSYLLDLACGKGRHAIYLNKLGYKVDGADLAPESIQHANQFSSDSLNFFEHDMRNDLNRTGYSHVFNLFTSFGYFENQDENLATLKSIYNSLQPNGILVIDFLNIELIAKSLVADEVKRCHDIDFKIQRKIEKDVINKTIKFTAEGQHYEFVEKVQALSLKDFENLLTKAGFVIKNVFGDYNLGKFAPETSNRLIIVSAKK